MMLLVTLDHESSEEALQDIRKWSRMRKEHRTQIQQLLAKQYLPVKYVETDRRHAYVLRPNVVSKLALFAVPLVWSPAGVVAYPNESQAQQEQRGVEKTMHVPVREGVGMAKVGDGVFVCVCADLVLV